MTVSTTQIRTTYSGDGVTTSFPTNFPFYLSTDLLVLLAGNSLSSGYSVSGGNGLPGTVVMASAPANGQTLQIILNVPFTQLVNLVDGTSFPSTTLNQVNDRAIQAILRLQDQVSRTLRAPDADLSPGLQLPPAASRAGMFLSFDSNGNAILASTGPGTSNTQATLGPIFNPQTSAEIAVGVTPTNFSIPSHVATGEIYPQRYGAKFDGVTNDTVAIQNAFNVANQAASHVVLPDGTAIVGSSGGGVALVWGQNSGTGASTHPPGLRGQGISTTLKAAPGFTGTVLGARGVAAQFMRDFVVDGSGTAAVCIDTSWPATIGTTTNNVYDNIWVQNFTQNGWLAINDNQAKWTSIAVRGAANFGLSGLRIEGSGGSFSFDNIQVADSFLSVTCQNCDIRGGFFYGLRLNESQSGVNYLYLSGCQIYANPTTLTHFTDANSTVHYSTSVVLESCYLLASSGTAQTFTIDCGVAGKWLFDGCAFIFGSSTGLWNLYGANSHAAVTPVFVELDGCTMTDGIHSVIINSQIGFITQRKDVEAGPANVVSDYPMRVVYRASIPFPFGLTANTYTNVVPPSILIEDNASFILCVTVSASGVDNLACSAFVSAISRQAGVGPTGAIVQGTTANIANNLVNAISLRYGVASNIFGTNQAGIDAAINIALPNNSSIWVTLIRLANPTINY